MLAQNTGSCFDTKFCIFFACPHRVLLPKCKCISLQSACKKKLPCTCKKHTHFSLPSPRRKSRHRSQCGGVCDQLDQWQVIGDGDCHIPVFRTQYQDYNYDFTRFFYLIMTPYEYLMTFIQITYIIWFILIPNSLAETVNP